MTNDSVDNTVDASGVGKAAHRPGTAPHLSECPLYHISSSHFFLWDKGVSKKLRSSSRSFSRQLTALG